MGCDSSRERILDAMPAGSGLVMRADSLPVLAGLPAPPGVRQDHENLSAWIQQHLGAGAAGPVAAYWLNTGRARTGLGLALQISAGTTLPPADRQRAYAGHTMLVYTDNGEELYASRQDELLLVGYQPVLVQEMIDALEADEQLFSRRFAAAKKGSGPWICLQGRELRPLLAPAADATGRALLERIRHHIAWLEISPDDTGRWMIRHWPVAGSRWEKIAAANNIPLHLLPAGLRSFSAGPASGGWWERALPAAAGTSLLTYSPREGQWVSLLPVEDVEKAAAAVEKKAMTTGSAPAEPYLNTEIRRLTAPGLMDDWWPPVLQGQLPWVSTGSGAIAMASHRNALEEWLDSRLLDLSLVRDTSFMRQLGGSGFSGSQRLHFVSGSLLQEWGQHFGLEIKTVPDNLLLLGDHRSSHWRWTAYRWQDSRADSSGTVASAWSFTGDAPLGTPRLVRYPDNRPAGQVAVQDDRRRLYLLDLRGSLLQRTDLPGLLLSGVVADRQGQWFFHTRDRFFHLGPDGQMQNNTPYLLPAPAAAPMTVVDFGEGAGGFTAFIPLQDGRILHWRSGMQQPAVWPAEGTMKPLQAPLVHYQDSLADYLFTLETGGRVRAFSRFGQHRWSFEYPGLQGPLLLDAALPDRPRLVVADTGGRVIAFNEKGDHFPLRLTDSLSHQFLLADLWGDNRKDYLIYRNGRLSLKGYGGDNSFATRRSIELQPAADTLFLIGEERPQLAGIDRERGLLYLYDADGNPLPDFPVAAQTGAVMVPAGDGGSLLLVVYGRELYALRRQQAGHN